MRTTESSGFSALLVAKADQAAMVKRILLLHGFDVLLLPNAAAASELSKQRRFDLAVYDEAVHGALELADYSKSSLHRVAIGLLADTRSSSVGVRLHFILRKPISVELFDKAVRAALAPIAADRRASFRHEANIQAISCLLHHRGSSRELRGASIVNLSLTGLCIYASEMLPQDGTVDLTFRLPPSYGNVHLNGTVVWSHSSGRCGVKFTSIDPLNQRKLEDWADGMVYSNV
jgi:PilZ domain